MSRSLRAALWTAVAAQVLLICGQVVVEARLLGTVLAPEGGAAGIMIGAVSLLAFPLVGGLLLHRRPENRVGWLFCVANLGWTINNCSGAYVRLDAVLGGLPAADLAVWLYTWPSFPASLAYVLILLTFPDGRLPSLRWRPVAWAAVGWAALASIGAAFAPGLVDETIRVAARNPLGVEAGPGALLYWIKELAFPLFAPLWVAAGAGLIVRYRRARLVERLQLKWFLSAVVVSVVAIVGFFGLVVYFQAVVGLPGWAQALQLAAILGPSLLIPLAAAAAILRYGLYDIDRIISRTLAYAVISAVLVGVYVGGILLLGPLVGRGSDLAVAGATLAAAALFHPLRRRVQAAVDRRFNRTRYDAERTVSEFTQRLRDAVELAELERDLVAAVHQAVEPARLSLWVRPRTGVRS